MRAAGDVCQGRIRRLRDSDLDGILMVAAQALEERTEELRRENAYLKARLEALERRLGTDGATASTRWRPTRRHAQ